MGGIKKLDKIGYNQKLKRKGFARKILKTQLAWINYFQAFPVLLSLSLPSLLSFKSDECHLLTLGAEYQNNKAVELKSVWPDSSLEAVPDEWDVLHERKTFYRLGNLLCWISWLLSLTYVRSGRLKSVLTAYNIPVAYCPKSRVRSNCRDSRIWTICT